MYTNSPQQMSVRVSALAKSTVPTNRKMYKEARSIISTTMYYEDPYYTEIKEVY